MFAGQLLKHGGECAAIHHLKEDPQPALEVKALEAANDAVVLLAHEHDTYLINDTLALLGSLGLNKLECADMVIVLSLDFENLGESTNSNPLNNVVVLARVFFF